MQKICETVPGRTHDRHPSRGNVFFYFLKFQIRILMLPRQPFFVGTRPKGFRRNLRRRRTFNLHFVGISKIKFLTYPRRSGSGVHVFFFSFPFFVFRVVYGFLVSLLYLTSEYSCRARLGSVRLSIFFIWLPHARVKNFWVDRKKKKTWVLQHVLGQNNLG